MSSVTLGDDPLDNDGPAAPPRANGELIFTEPWQSRLFATTIRLWQGGHFEWDQLRQRLIDQIAAHETALPSPNHYDYWGCWQLALESLLADQGFVSAHELATTSHELTNRHPNHDHHDDDVR